MSHLGRRLSALVDGELGDTERDQVHAHLVGCDECRAEAAALRALKRRVRGLGEAAAFDGAPAESDLTSRLIALGGLAGPLASRPDSGARVPAARSVFPGGGAARPGGWDGARQWLAGGPGRDQLSPLAAAPFCGGHLAGRGRGHTRYVVAGAVAALAVGLGAASFAAGGADHLPGPTVTPQVDVFMLQHAVTSGSLPWETGPRPDPPGP